MAQEAWGRWGAEDECGALNTIGPNEVRRAATLVRSGRVFALAQPISQQTPVPSHRTSVIHLMNRDGGDYASGGKRPGGFQFSDDTIVMPVHVGTHIDALCHAWYGDRLYNGFSGNSIRSTVGATHCGVEKLTPLVTRGVLLDIAGRRGAPLQKGSPISATELGTCATAAGIQLNPGDAVLIRTGWLETHGHDATEYFSGEPGIDVDGALWLAKASVALVAADNFGIEAIPFPAGMVFPVHQLLIRDFGIPLLEGLVLKELAEAKATEFLFVAAPLPIVGGTGSPLCPIAVV